MISKKDIDFNIATMTTDVEQEDEKKATRIDEENAEVKDYYEKMRCKIIEIYEKGEKQKALDMLWEELQQPYLPLSVEQDFYDLYNAYSLALREEALKIDWNTISKNEIHDRILNKSTGAIDLYFLNLYLVHILESKGLDPNQQNNITLDQEDSIFIQFLLTHPYIINMEKYNLLVELKNNGVNQEFKYINTNFVHNHQCNGDCCHDFVVNPTKMILPEQNPIVKEVAKEFENMDAKRPDILNYEMELLYIIYVFVFPRQEIAHSQKLVKAISSYVHGIFEGTTYDKNDPIIQIIESELARISELDNNPYAF